VAATRIDYKKTKSQDEAFQKVKALITPDYLSKFHVKVDLTFDEIKRYAVATGQGFKLTMKFFDAHCEVDLDLSLLLRPLKTTILGKIEHQIEKNL
jgi:hypothetical protein